MKLKSVKLYIIPAFLLLSAVAPLVSQAQATSPTQINQIITTLIQTATRIISLLFVVATVVFLWGVIIFITKADDEGARKKARGIMTWGIVGMAVMASGWGLSNILIRYFGVGGGGPNVDPGTLLPRGIRLN